MITTAQIINAVNKTLYEKFPDIPRYSHDVAEGFTEECFYVVAGSVIPSSVNEYYHQSNLTIRIIYFPESRYINISELMGMESSISELFRLTLKVNDTFIIPVTEIDFEISDNNVLTASIELEYYEQIAEEGDYDMENLEVDTKLEEA